MHFLFYLCLGVGGWQGEEGGGLGGGGGGGGGGVAGGGILK